MAGASGGDISGQKMRLAERWPGALWCDFGDSPELSAHLLGLIRSGAKTATCGALRDYQAVGDPLPRAGDVMIARDHSGQPALVYELTEVVIRPFDEVPEEFALAEGEGDFAAWRAAHEAFFARNGGFSSDMPVVCERFRLIEVLA
ncbi:MAG: ASCH domain-containing protein [Paracoccus sp. (in: a-proteobacteria)]|uniref:ASCH domain-containing protein n=1 Tax=Paracoccus sp. TaxID=267 RepID=UPI0026DFAC81|nr:ASCH domain-containing protein [Paracoccus sp. (in: a-proteobacteria)]MDO5631429.1 ASCH domain-containing protein [Paracoccus sp. (in: a-proteobacteria)]